MAAPRAGVPAGQLQPAGLLAASITHQVVEVPGLVDVCDFAVTLAAHLQAQHHDDKLMTDNTFCWHIDPRHTLATVWRYALHTLCGAWTPVCWGGWLLRYRVLRAPCKQQRTVSMGYDIVWRTMLVCG